VENMFIAPLKNLLPYKNLLKDIENNKTPISTHGIIEEGIGHIVYALNQCTNKQILLITHNENRAKKIYEDIKTFNGEEVEIFPSREMLFYKIDAISTDRLNQRLKVLSRLVQGENIILVASIEGLLDRLMNPDLFQENSIAINLDNSINLEKLGDALIYCGYERENMVEGIGQFSIRGGIIDIFPPNNDYPYRIELFGDEVDSIRTFDIESQRSLENLSEVFICPSKEILILNEFRNGIIKNLKDDLGKTTKNLKKGSKTRMNMEDKFQEILEKLDEKLYISNIDLLIPYMAKNSLSNLLNYLKEDSIVFIDEPQRIEEKSDVLKEEFNYEIVDKLDAGEILSSHGKIKLDYMDILKETKRKITIVNTELLKQSSYFQPQSILNFSSKSVQSFHNDLEFLKEELEYHKYRGYKTIIFSGTEDRGKRLQEALMDLNLETLYVEDSAREIKSSEVFITPGNINGGFEYPHIKLLFISDKEIYGSSKERRRKEKRKKPSTISFSDLNPGDFVVHENHGIGQYKGIEQIDIQGIKKDYLTINYKGGDKLYVPTDQMNLIQKYIGSDSIKPKVNRLSSSDWLKTKTKAKKAVEDMAVDLLELYAKRESLKGFAFSPDTPWQNQFEDFFPYEETDGQIRSSIEIKEDMEKPKPMDRLLCGDVGYGKTEVALRAAFKAVMDGKQVAFLVPTTILAQQHYNTMIERFENFPIEIGMLSRFRTPKQQKNTIDGLRIGTVDIVIGTHRLLSKDVVFKDLGLLIVDEEQRFGVKHKERLKQLKENVDVLTLTATPIPRTLHMSLIGIRDMSVIEDPPEERYPVQTYVVEFNEQIVREAILKEIERGGQVYFVYNRVGTIDKMAAELKELVPEASIGIGHGQMTERELENVMLDFIEGEYNVLVCTTIIETGLDIQNVNTIIIYNADKMGLSQLYQLRGRVGRTNRLAYAYFTYEKDKVLTEVAEKRLRAIKDFTEFGSGFKVAMRDLEIRGAGNLLGVAQHGHIESIGYDLYVKFLNESIKRLKGEPLEEKIETTIDLNVDGYIPNSYIEDGKQKIEIYKKIAAIDNLENYGELVDELIDRYGDIPKEVENLMDISYIKNNGSKAYINNIYQLENILVLEFSSINKIAPDLVHYLSESYGRKMNFDLSNSPKFKYRYNGNILLELKEIIEKINSFNDKKNHI